MGGTRKRPPSPYSKNTNSANPKKSKKTSSPQRPSAPPPPPPSTRSSRSGSAADAKKKESTNVNVKVNKTKKDNQTTPSSTSKGNAEPKPSTSTSNVVVGNTKELSTASWYYAQGSKPTGISRTLKRSYFQKASKLYLEQTKNEKRTPFELSSIWRNIGMCNLKLALVIDEVNTWMEVYWIMGALKDSISAFRKALEFREEALNDEWGLLVREKISEVFEIAFTTLGLRSEKSNPSMWSRMDELYQLLPAEGPMIVLSGYAYLQRGRFWYNSAVLALEKQDFRKSSQYLEYARQDTCAIVKYYSDENVEFENRVLEGDIYNHSCSTESKRVFELADLGLTKIVFEAEKIDLRLVWDIMDQFKDAALLTRDKDLESEARAMSRIGRIYTSIIKMPNAGHKYYKEAFTLVQSLAPRDLTKLDWMIETKAAMEAYQQKIYADEQKKLDELRAPYLLKLASVIDKIKIFNEEHDGVGLLKHVFANHPPKCKYEFDPEKVDTPRGTSLKGSLKKAIIYYHPDKQKEYDMEWQVLAGEITKYLTAAYEVTKGID